MIQTVTGPVEADSLGQTLIHEHFTCADWSMRMNFGKTFFDDTRVLARAVDWAKDALQHGIHTIVDGTPVNLGRDVRFLKAIADASGMTILASSGFYYQDEPWLEMQDPAVIREWLTRECQEGIDGTGIRPAIMKAAVSDAGITPVRQKVLTATAQTAAACHLPLFCHHDVTIQSGQAILDVFEQAGLAPEHVVLGHCGDSDDLDYLTGLLKRGCFIGMDRFGVAAMYLPVEKRLQVIDQLCQDGYADRLLLSHDLAAYYGFMGSLEREADFLGPDMNFSYISREILPALRDRGVSDPAIDQMLIHNPAAVLGGTHYA